MRDMGIEDQKYVKDNNIMVFTIPDEDLLAEQLVEERKNHNSDVSDVSEEEEEVVLEEVLVVEEPPIGPRDAEVVIRTVVDFSRENDMIKHELTLLKILYEVKMLTRSKLKQPKISEFLGN